ncbi:hypothetical protein ACFQZE_07090 [Paenibacillus sp. GCM10027627]|uniref:hypothetical protein n=1 Tax=unclassified Paenibacillus TaxID=185978 RepID=UPI00362AA12D
MEINYKPKLFKRKILGIFQETRGARIQFEKTSDSGASYILVDESTQKIVDRMDDVIRGKRDKVYLSRGMRNIDIECLTSGKWQLFDEFDIYQFDKQ